MSLLWSIIGVYGEAKSGSAGTLEVTSARHSRAVSMIRRSALLIAVACILSKPAALVAISGYQRFVSPHKGWACAYAILHGGPSCSAYGKEVISRQGVLVGMCLLWNRFGDCARRRIPSRPTQWAIRWARSVPTVACVDAVVARRKEACPNQAQYNLGANHARVPPLHP